MNAMGSDTVEGSNDGQYMENGKHNRLEVMIYMIFSIYGIQLQGYRCGFILKVCRLVLVKY